MFPDLALRMASHLLWSGLLISAPLLIIILLVGILVSVIQVVTQIQDMSLTFIPKLICVVIGVSVFGAWMMRQLSGYVINLWSTISTLA